MSIGSVMGPGGPGPDQDEEPARKRRGLRALLYGLIALLVLVLLAAAGVVLVTQHLGSQVGRYPSVFAPIDPSSRPADAAGQTFLLMGTDTRSPEATTGTDAAPDAVFGSTRSDVIMVATIAEDGQSASIISIPRDSWVDVPGRGKNKINAAYAFGGPPLLIETVEQLSRVHIDHFAVIDFAGFAQMTDAVGGIDVNVGQETERDGVVVPAGPQHLNGEQALVYVRERKSLPGGDLDRVRRQQAALRAFVQKTLSSGTLSSPPTAYAAVDTVDPPRRRGRLAVEHRPRPARVRHARPAQLVDLVPHRARHRDRRRGRAVGRLPRRGRRPRPVVRGQHRRRAAVGRRPPAGAALGHPALTCTRDAANGYLAASMRTKSALITGIRRAAGAGVGGS